LWFDSPQSQIIFSLFFHRLFLSWFLFCTKDYCTMARKHYYGSALAQCSLCTSTYIEETEIIVAQITSDSSTFFFRNIPRQFAQFDVFIMTVMLLDSGHVTMYLYHKNLINFLTRLLLMGPGWI